MLALIFDVHRNGQYTFSVLTLYWIIEYFFMKMFFLYIRIQYTDSWCDRLCKWILESKHQIKCTYSLFWNVTLVRAQKYVKQWQIVEQPLQAKKI